MPKDPTTQRPKLVKFGCCRKPFGDLGIWVLGCLLLTGCGPTKPETIPVTGEVFFDGQPIEGANVVFTPDGPPATATTDAEGKFTLRTFSDGDGAVPGHHRVTITKNVSAPTTPENPYPVPQNMLPANYGRPDSSGLSAEVGVDNDNTFRFDLAD